MTISVWVLVLTCGLCALPLIVKWIVTIYGMKQMKLSPAVELAKTLSAGESFLSMKRIYQHLFMDIIAYMAVTFFLIQVERRALNALDLLAIMGVLSTYAGYQATIIKSDADKKMKSDNPDVIDSLKDTIEGKNKQ